MRTFLFAAEPWALLLAVAVPLACASKGTDQQSPAVGVGAETGGVCAATCLSDCQNDDDCDIADGELCCDYGEDGKACVPAVQCPRMCSDDADCDVSAGQACGPVLISRDAKICTSPTNVVRHCDDDEACEDGEKCCGIYDDPVCLPTSLCPTTCSEGSDCDSAAGEVCCETLDDVNPALSADGLCVHPTLVTCPETCSQSTDCDTQLGEICCNGVCSAACAESCETSNDCRGEICCHSQAARSPFRVGEILGYPVLTVVTPVTPTPITPVTGTCTNTCLYAYDGYCDDGGAGAFSAYCALGTDCYDCGTR